MSEEKNEKWIKGGWVLLCVLVVACVWTVVILLRHSEPIKPAEEKSESEKSKVITKQALPAFTLLNGADLEQRKGVEDSSAPTVAELEGRYLLEALKSRAEVKRNMVAPKGATESTIAALANTVAVSIPATATNSLGSTLQTGDTIDLIVAPPRDGSRPATEPADGLKKFDNLLVLGVGPKADAKAADRDGAAGAITLALPKGRLDEFASALPGATLLVTRKSPAAK